MNAKVYSTFFTVSWLLGLAGTTASCAAFSVAAYAQKAPVISGLLLAIAVSMLVFASRVHFPKNEEIARDSISDVQVVGGPFLYVCFLKKKRKWRWFCFDSDTRSAFERAFAVDV